MNALEPAATSLTNPEGQSYTLPPNLAALMSQDEGHEKLVPASLTAYEDARKLVQLICCPQCSQPFRSPVTLPCGNSLCRDCLPEAHRRENISYPDLPGRRRGFQCPFKSCAEEHPSADCNIDVTLTKVMDSIAEVVVRHTSIAGDTPTLLEVQPKWNEVDPSEQSSEKPRSQTFSGGRLIATYTFAARGELGYYEDLTYQTLSETGDEYRNLDAAVLKELLESTHREVDCQVCYNMMLDPVTTFCGHTLCRKCLARVLDHSSHCPVCRRGLAIPSSLISQPSNKTLVNLLNGLCPDAVAARAEAVAFDERGEGELNVPLFICTLGFPGMPTFLRIFEPRYRLMLRRAVDSNREFGMLMYNRYGEPQGDLGPVHFYHYGTMLRIINAQIMPDGTSLIETRGVSRFKVKAHGTLDGYTVGNVERIEDVSLTEEERLEAEETSLPPAAETDTMGQLDRMSTRDLLSLGHEFVLRMQARSAGWLQQRVLDIHGQPPEDASLFPYWFASVLPINDEEKYKLLGTTSVRARLKITAAWIRRIESQRW